MEQTAVEWFAEITAQLGYVSTDILKQAKEMEQNNTKKLLEIIMWYDEQSDVRPDAEIYTWFQQYYNETFKSE